MAFPELPSDQTNFHAFRNLNKIAYPHHTGGWTNKINNSHEKGVAPINSTWEMLEDIEYIHVWIPYMIQTNELPTYTHVLDLI